MSSQNAPQSIAGSSLRSISCASFSGASYCCERSRRTADVTRASCVSAIVGWQRRHVRRQCSQTKASSAKGSCFQISENLFSQKGLSVKQETVDDGQPASTQAKGGSSRQRLDARLEAFA